MKKKLTLSLILYILTSILFAETVIIDRFNYEGLQLVHGQYGKKYLQLSDGEYNVDPFTDLLMHFNNNMFLDDSGNYTINKHYNNITPNEKKFGNASMFLLKNRGISLTSSEETLFSPGRVIDDFTIEFWIRPTVISEDSILFSWKGVNKVDSEFIPQKIRCYMEERYIVWEFDNFFIPNKFEPHNIKLKSLNRIIPEKWSHITVRYQSETGMLETLIDGLTNAVQYTTDTGMESNNIYQPIIGNFSKNNIYIGENFQGFIDEFRISEMFIDHINKSSYRSEGLFISDVFNLDNKIIKQIDVIDITPSETLIDYYIRSSDTPFLSDDIFIEWTPLSKFATDKTYRYIQLKGELHSDGDSNKTPKFEKFNLEVERVIPPPPPLYISSTASVGKITVEWTSSKYFPVDGYYLYIGDKKNNYTEIIDVGKKTTYTVDNLQSKKIYYFAVRAYKNSLKSEYSTEIYNRPE